MSASCEIAPGGGAMLISRDRLSIGDITDYWSREIQPPTLREELQDFLEAAWWRGELKTDGPLTPLALLKSMVRSAREGDSTSLVFVTAILPKGVELADGSLQLDVNDLRPHIIVPSDDLQTWTEASCTPAFQALAQRPSRKYYPDRTFQFLMMEIDRHQFVRLLTAHGLDLPKFWRLSISKPRETQKEEGESPGVGSEVRRRGPRPKKLEQTKEAMRRDLRENGLTPASLREMREKGLKERYSVSRDTARKARAEILSEEAMRRDIRERRLTLARLREMRDEELKERYGVSRGKGAM
jgi:hypothetical protein